MPAPPSRPPRLVPGGDPAELAELPPGYEAVGRLGVGGMGEVWEVRNLHLDRREALKRLRPDRIGDPASFEREMRVVASLDHPAVVPLFAAGALPQGGAWFTMKLLRGGSLAEAAHPGRSLDWLAEVYTQVAEALAAAHALGVVHLDLKPANVLLGAEGEVRVADWGLAALLAEGRGQRGGTPGFIAPERRGGERVTPAADVWSLGASLEVGLRGIRGEGPAAPGPEPLPAAGPGGPPAWGLLGSATSPVPGAAPAQEVGGADPGRGPTADDPLAAALERIVDACLAPRPDRRPPAATVAARLRDALEEARRTRRAERWLAEAQRLEERSAAARARARSLEEAAGRALASLPRSAAPARARPAWALVRSAGLARAEAEAASGEVERLLDRALLGSPDHPAVHRYIAERERRAADEARRVGDTAAAARATERVRVHDREGRQAGWLAGRAALSLATDPPGAEVWLYTLRAEGPRHRAERGARLGTTPLVDVPVPAGDHVLLLRAPRRAPVRLPLRLGPEERGPAGPPEGGPFVVRLPPPLPAGDRYVPAGWFEGGGDSQVADCLPAGRWWVEGFVMRRHPVTVAEWFRFLDALVDGGREEEAQRHAPAAERGDGRAPQWRLAADGRHLVPFADDSLSGLDPEWPVTHVDAAAADAFAAWYTRDSGLPWRLPHEIEWEKAARGADRRPFPWGSGFDVAWAAVAQRLPGPPDRVPVRSFPWDRSPFSVCGLGGNVRDWCANGWSATGAAPGRLDPGAAEGDPALRVLRGGAWLFGDTQARAAGRVVARPADRRSYYGLRLVRSWP